MAKPTRAAPTKKTKRKRNPWLRALGWFFGIMLGLGVVGAAAVVVAYARIEIPDPNADFRTNTTFVYYADGKTELGSFQVQNRVSIPFEQMNPLAVDAIVTAETGVALCVRVADCLPVVLADPASRVIGVAHAGREGLAAGVLPETVEAMRRAGAEQIAAWIGPHICGRCYEVGDDVAERVGRRLPEAVAKTAWGTTSLDLGAAAIAQLEALECSLRWVGPCTRTSPDLFSHRRDGAQAGRQAGLAWLT